METAVSPARVGAKKRKWHSKLHRIGGACGWRCYYCNCELECVKCHPFTDRMATRDHVVPKSKGGMNEYANLVLACTRCNNKKGSRSASAFMVAASRVPFTYTVGSTISRPL